MNIVVDAFTKAETRQYVADTIKTMTGGESAADVKLLLENHIADYEEKVGQIDSKDSAQDTAIAAAQSQADKGVADAAKVAADLVTANLAIAENTREIGVAKSSIETVNTTLSGKITALENADTTIKSDITALETIVKGEGGHTSKIAALESRASALENKDTELAASIKANADKFVNYYTTTQVDEKVQEAIDAIPEVDFTPYAKTADVESALALKADKTALEALVEDLTEEVDRAKAAEKKISDDLALLIENPTEALDSVKELIEHVQANGTAVTGIITRLDGHDAKLAGIDSTVVDVIDSKIAAAAYALPVATVDALGGVKSSEAENGVAVAADGTMSVNNVNVNKLVQTEGEELILNGGSAK
jgi:prophage DNA circulation protein